MRKKGGNKKKSLILLQKGRRFLYSCVLLRFGNSLKLTPLSSAPLLP
jgi:hypothetical protein